MFAGIMSGILSVFVSYPFDTVKANKQTKINFTTYQTINNIRSKYGLAGFYRGLSVPMMLRAVKKGSQFYIFEKCNTNPYTAGFIAGSTGSIINSPLHTIMTQMQTKNHKNVIRCIKQLGLKNIFKPFPYQLARDSVFGSIYLGTYGYIRTKYPNMSTFNATIAGGIIGVVTWTIGYPLDTILTRKQFNVKHLTNIKGTYYAGLSLVLFRTLITNMVTIGSYHHFSKH